MSMGRQEPWQHQECDGPQLLSTQSPHTAAARDTWTGDRRHHSRTRYLQQGRSQDQHFFASRLHRDGRVRFMLPLPLLRSPLMRSLSRHLVFTMGKGAYTGSAAGRVRQRMEGQCQGQHYWMRPCTASHTQSSQEASRSTPK